MRPVCKTTFATGLQALRRFKFMATDEMLRDVGSDVAEKYDT